MNEDDATLNNAKAVLVSMAEMQMKYPVKPSLGYESKSDPKIADSVIAARAQRLLTDLTSIRERVRVLEKVCDTFATTLVQIADKSQDIVVSEMARRCVANVVASLEGGKVE